MDNYFTGAPATPECEPVTRPPAPAADLHPRRTRYPGGHAPARVGGCAGARRVIPGDLARWVLSGVRQLAVVARLELLGTSGVSATRAEATPARSPDRAGRVGRRCGAKHHAIS